MHKEFPRIELHLINMLLNEKMKIIMLVLVFLFLSISVLSSQDAVVFRYSSDPICIQAQSDVELKHVSVEHRWDEEEATARGDGGWGYNVRSTSLFDHDSSIIQTTGNLVITFSGPHTFSGELWFKSYNSYGSLFNWGDSTRPYAFNLLIEDSAVVFAYTFRDCVYTVQTNNSIYPGKWTHINWYCDVRDDSLLIGIYRSGSLEAEQAFELTIPPIYTVYNDTVIIGSIPGFTAFNGEIYAVNLKNYFFKKDYTLASMPYDGSGYCGIPDYFDNHLGTYIDNIDERVTESPTSVVVNAFVPYQNDDFIPQGVTNSFEDEEYSGPAGMIYLSLYNKTIFGASGQKNSIIVEMDPQNDFSVRRCFKLEGVQSTGHNGGIAFHNNSIYVATNYKVGAYALPEYSEESDKYQTLSSNSANIFNVSSKASFMTYHSDSVWIGEYREPSDGFIPYLFGYPLDSNGNIIISADPIKYKLPFYSQGAAWRENDGEKYLLISTTRGGGEYSILYRCLRSGLSEQSEITIDREFYLPAQIEDVSFNQDGDLITVSESGSKYYQLAVGWSMFYPFVFTITNDILFAQGEQVSNDKDKDIGLLPKFEIYQNFPNPFNNNTSMEYILPEDSFVRLNVYDLLGRDVRTLVNGTRKKGNYRIYWDGTTDDGDLVPAGVYLYTITTGKHFLTRKMLLLK